MKYGTPILNYGLLMVTAILVAVFGLYEYRQGAFLQSGEQVVTGTLVESYAPSGGSGCLGCSDGHSVIVTTSLGLALTLNMPNENLDVGSDPVTEAFLAKALIGFHNGRISNGRVEVHGNVDSTSRTISVTKEGEYVKAL